MDPSVKLTVVVSDSDEDPRGPRTPQKQKNLREQPLKTPHEERNKLSVRRSRRSINLDDSDDADNQGSTCSQRPPETLTLSSSATSPTLRGQVTDLAPCISSPAVSTPEPSSKARSLRDSPQRIPVTTTISGPAAHVLASTRMPTPLCSRRRLRRIAVTDEDCRPATKDGDSSLPRPRRRSKLLVLSEQDSEDDVKTGKKRERGRSSCYSSNSGKTSETTNSNNSSNSNSTHGSTLACSNNSSSTCSSSTASVNTRQRRLRGCRDPSSSPLREPISLDIPLENQGSCSSSNSNGFASAECSDTRREKGLVSCSRSSSPLPPPRRRLRRHQEGSRDKVELQNEPEADKVSKYPAAGLGLSPKEVQQRLKRLAKIVKEKSLRTRGAHAAEEPQGDDDSGSDSENSEKARKGALRLVRPPLSTRMASKFFCFSRDHREAVEDSEESGGSFIDDSSSAGEAATSASEEDVPSESSDSSEDEVLSALRFHNRIRDQEEKAQNVEQTLRLKECFELYVFSLALSLFSPELSLKVLQEKGLSECRSSAAHTEPVAKALAALTYLEVTQLVAATERIERLTLAKRNAMETHTFPPECKANLKKYPQCRVSDGPEFQGATTRCIVCHRTANRHHYLDLFGTTYDSDAVWEGDLTSWLTAQGLDWIGGEGSTLHSAGKPKDLVATYEQRHGQEFPVGAKCGKQAALWHSVHHYKSRLLLNIHSILSLRRPDELLDPYAAAERLRDLHAEGLFEEWDEEVTRVPIPR